MPPFHEQMVNAGLTTILSRQVPVLDVALTGLADAGGWHKKTGSRLAPTPAAFHGEPHGKRTGRRQTIPSHTDQSDDMVWVGGHDLTRPGCRPWFRRHRALHPLLSTAHDFLRMLHDAPADAGKAATLDTYFTVMAESGLSASTFTVRVVASTRALVTASVLAAWCAFTGAPHGSAPGPTLDLRDAAGAQALSGWRSPIIRKKCGGPGDRPGETRSHAAAERRGQGRAAAERSGYATRGVHLWPSRLDAVPAGSRMPRNSKGPDG